MNEAMARQYLDYNGEMPQTLKEQAVRSVARRHFNTEMPTAEQIKEMEPKVKSYFNNNKKRVPKLRGDVNGRRPRPRHAHQAGQVGRVACLRADPTSVCHT